MGAKRDPHHRESDWKGQGASPTGDIRMSHPKLVSQEVIYRLLARLRAVPETQLRPQAWPQSSGQPEPARPM